MSMDAERSRTSPVESIVAREHWDAIARSAMAQGGVLILVALILGMPVYGALTLIHIVTLLGAIFANVMALRLEEEGRIEPAVQVARRSLGALAVSTASMAVLTAMG
ncbi:hypothetical protein [Azospirillum sp. ST 5-10]|uniref:hypothetical protein n=1 Tax=unclassified Azospirillum TaxID=2630922 RepID=UPI003F49EA8A